MKSIKRLNVHSNAPVVTSKHPMGQVLRVWQEAGGGGMVLRTYSIPNQVVVGGVMLMCDLEVISDDDVEASDPRGASTSASYDRHRLSFTSTSRRAGKSTSSSSLTGTPRDEKLSAGRSNISFSQEGVRVGVAAPATSASSLTSDLADSATMQIRRHSTPAASMAPSLAQRQTLISLHSDLVDVFGTNIMTPQPVTSTDHFDNGVNATAGNIR